MTDDEYYNYTTTKEGIPVLSSSLLKSAMPMEGGNVDRIHYAYNKYKDNKETPAKKLGSLLHLYSEKPDRFVFQPEWTMSPAIKSIVDMIWNNLIEGAPVSENLNQYPEAIKASAVAIGYGQKWKPDTVVSKVIESGGPYWQFLLAKQGKIPVFGPDLEKMKGMIKSIEGSEIYVPFLKDPEADEVYREKVIVFDLGDGYLYIGAF